MSLPKPGAIAAFALVAALAATGAPLLVYTMSLALFGLPHVLAELRYVDDRFGARLDRPLIVGLVALTTAAVLVRLVGIMGALPGGLSGGSAELLLLAGLGALVVPALFRGGVTRGGLGTALCLAIGVAAVTAPLPTLVGLAVLHNLSPVAFLAERLRGLERTRTMLAAALLFLVVPVLIASGLPFRMLAAVGLVAPEASLLSVGPLSAHLGAFVPGNWTTSPLAVHLFSAAVYLQLLHYGAVLHVLPGLTKERVVGRWPRGRRGIVALGLVGALFFGAFALSFGDAKAAYGLFALVHAWIELPLLFGALGAAAPRASILMPEVT